MKLIVIIAVLLTIIDQISKLFITRLMNVKHSIKIIDNFFYLTYTHNQGAAFSILTGQRIFLIIITILIIILLLSYLKKNFPKDKLTKFSFALILGGSLGNLIDRIVRGSVIDFLDFKIFSYNFPIFNLADTFITIGVILLIIITFRKEDKK